MNCNPENIIIIFVSTDSLSAFLLNTTMVDQLTFPTVCVLINYLSDNYETSIGQTIVPESTIKESLLELLFLNVVFIVVIWTPVLDCIYTWIVPLLQQE